MQGMVFIVVAIIKKLSFNLYLEIILLLPNASLLVSALAAIEFEQTQRLVRRAGRARAEEFADNLR